MGRPVPPGAPATAHHSQVRLSWLLAALGLLGAAAILCAYFSLCLLFYQGQWQLLYHPTPLGRQTPSSAGLAFVSVQFGASDSGTPRLTGWWLPAPASASTVIYLHGEAGSLGDTIPALARIHAAGLNIFAIDYRGYGASQAGHPTEAKMVEDAQAARSYLIETRHIPAGAISVWGKGVGATIAAEAFCRDSSQPIILEEINPPARHTVAIDPRTRLLPVGFLLRDRLDPTQALVGCHSPKLFLRYAAGTVDDTPTGRLYRMASEPKQLADGASAVPRFIADVLAQGSGSKP